MHSIIVIFQFIIMQAQAKNLAPRHKNHMQDSMGKLAGKLVDKTIDTMFDRRLKDSPALNADLESTTLAKRRQLQRKVADPIHNHHANHRLLLVVGSSTLVNVDYGRLWRKIVTLVNVDYGRLWRKIVTSSVAVIRVLLGILLTFIKLVPDIMRVSLGIILKSALKLVPMVGLLFSSFMYLSHIAGKMVCQIEDLNDHLNHSLMNMTSEDLISSNQPSSELFVPALTHTTFDDVEGFAEAKDEMKEVHVPEGSRAIHAPWSQVAKRHPNDRPPWGGENAHGTRSCR
jgi:hypothetical protein